MKDVTIEGFEQLRISVSAGAMLKAGRALVKVIRARTLSGLDKHGREFKPYSTKTFAMPAGGATKRARQILVKDGAIQYFTTGSGSLWMLVNGYLALKRATYKKTGWNGQVNLTMTGQMLGSMTVIEQGDNTVTIGFNRTEDALKAFWNIEKGRDFFGLSDEELRNPVIADILKSGIKLS